ncbi:hypothetical protein Q9K01_10955 [Qipengyuania sp. DY56-A-20]|uniref:Uncharacterized protein n=1 Tax=Qipengyuania benthica TaxID=3067651 RepID=A0ABT9HA57_9SPHN|nr:hypothetical protein [Qipengyuania sp. DY56-A-20]MDP4540146.1 hypothetical protein [Qipengyuania sp. DY56-A-20]
MMLYNGQNNGSLYLSAKDLTARLGLADNNVALRAFNDLQERGFIECAKAAHFAVKASDTSRARCWRLTWHAWPESPVRARRAPTRAWLEYRPEGGTKANKRADRRLRALAKYRKDEASGRLPDVKSTPTEVKVMRNTVNPDVKSTPAKCENGAIPPFVVGVDSKLYIDVTMGEVVGWWSNAERARMTATCWALVLASQAKPLRMAA